MAYKQLRDAKIFYQEKGHGPTLLLIHGTGFNSYCWTKVVDLFATKFRVITYDRRNYGKSTGSPAVTNQYYTTQGNDLIELLEALELTNVTLLGWSAGGMVAYHALLKDSSRINKLICYEPPLHAVKHMSWYLFRHFVKINLQKYFQGAKRGALAFTKMVSPLRTGGSSLDIFQADFEAIYSKDCVTALAEFAAGTSEDLTVDRLRSISVPIVFITGALSIDVFQQATKRQVKVFSAENYVMQNCGHFGQIECPEVFASTLLGVI